MRGPVDGFWFECIHCGFLGSSLESAIGAVSQDERIDEECRYEALRNLRKSNFQRVVDRLVSLRRDRSARLLDVGCGHGWFLEVASNAGFDVTGIEPDSAIAAVAISQGLTVMNGYFPEDCPVSQRFDVIAFNDVLEHMRNPGVVIAAVLERLDPGGLVSIVLPNSRGILFRAARVLAGIGVKGPLERMWQRGFPSPHVSYFEPNGLATLMDRHGFVEVHRSSLPSVSRRGLWQRLRYDRHSSLPFSVVQFLLLYAAIPLLGFVTSDISFQVFERR